MMGNLPKDPDEMARVLANSVSQACEELGGQLAQANIPASPRNASAMLVLGVRMVYLSMRDHNISDEVIKGFVELMINAGLEAGKAENARVDEKLKNLLKNLQTDIVN